MTITESLLALAKDHAQKTGAARVTDLYIVIGQLSSFVDDSIQFYWDILSQDTICQGAKLHFERVPARLSCLDCGREYGLEGELTVCPGCAGARVKVAAGMEFRLDSIGVETDDQTKEKEG